MKATFIIALMICSGLCISNNLNAQNGRSLTDTRDMQVYGTVKIGEQVWMAENLKYKMNNSWCYWDIPESCKTYGRLYSWSAAKRACPSGYHLPTLEEWNVLIDSLGGIEIAGGKLKKAGTEHWRDPNKVATNESGFNAIGAGKWLDGENYIMMHSWANFWSATEYDQKVELAYGIVLAFDEEDVYVNVFEKYDGFSVRCVKDR